MRTHLTVMQSVNAMLAVISILESVLAELTADVRAENDETV